MKRIIYLGLIFLAGCAPASLEIGQNFYFREVAYLGPLKDATNNGDGVITGKTSDSAVKAAVLPPLKASLASFHGELPYGFNLWCRVQLPTKFIQVTSLLTNGFLFCEYDIKNLRSGASVVEKRTTYAAVIVTPGMDKSKMLEEMGKKLTGAVRKDLIRLSK